MIRTVSLLFLLCTLSAAVPNTVFPTSEKDLVSVLQTTEKDGVPIHGNWCGPLHGFGTCIDALDCVCRTHDLCYGTRGYLSCKCDNDLVNSLSSNSNVKAKLVAAAFKFSPCRGPKNIPGIKTCPRCITVFGKNICWNEPCGIKYSCGLGLVLSNKSSYTKYSC